MSKTILLTDRSGHVNLLNCPRLGYWTRYYQNGTNHAGLQTQGTPLYITVGQAVHYGVQQIAQGVPYETVLPRIRDFFVGPDLIAESDHLDNAFARREACQLAQALTLVWYKERWPFFQQEYRVAAAEPEIRCILYEDANYVVMLNSKPDMILERISDVALLQWELKTKQSVNKNWVDSWEHNLQLVAQQIAIKSWAGDRPVVGAMVEALIKGKREKDNAGVYKQQSPLIYAYVQRGDGLLVEDRLSPTWRRGMPKLLVSDFIPLDRWVLNELGSDVTATKAVVVPAIQPDEDEIKNAAEQWGQQVICAYECAHHIDISEEQTKMHWLNRYFPQNTDHCFRYGRCDMYDMCWSPSVAADPIGSGKYVARVPHHDESLED